MRNNTPIRGIALALVLAGTVTSQDKKTEDFMIDDVLGAMKWRSVGPARFGGRIVDFAVHPTKSQIFYVATSSGGLFKTSNNGITFGPSFQYESVISIGDVAISKSNPEVLYIGTGEANNQRSSYWGRGVYKSTDAGKTWKNIGLKGTEHIGRVVVHPEDENTVYVAALGALYSPNEDRGVYRTVDGGKTWVKVKYIDENVGFVDVALDPNNPKTLYAASYERRRRAWNFDGTGPGAAVWKTTDGGDTWSKLEGGLPTGEIGRIGFDLFDAGDKTVVYATVENGNRRRAAPRGNGGNRGAAERGGAERGGAGRGGSGRGGAARGRARSRTVGGEIYRSEDGGESFTKINENPVGGSPGYYYGQIRVDPTDEKRIYVLGVPVSVTSDGGKTWRTDGARGVHVDHHALWINPKNPRHLLLGNDGGVHISYDYGKTWDHLNHLSIGQFYAVSADLSEPYWIYGGTQDNGTWGIPSRAPRSGGVGNRHAVKISGGDGFFVQVDPLDPATVYCESQFGGLSRLDLSTGGRKSIKPRSGRGGPRLRFNWCSPIELSPHNHHTVYFGSQFLHKSTNRGDKWQTISEDLTTDDEEKIKGNVPHCTITTISESPKIEGLIWVGTDDGRVQVTRDGGGKWEDLSDRIEDLPPRLWVSRIEASPSNPEVAYVSFTGYREDIRDPFLYMTKDGGETFTNIAGDLPKEPINVVREHPRNKGCLLVGTEMGVLCSLNGGVNWYTMQGDMPTVAVHDLMVHPRENDLIVGTHGKGIYLMDITPLAELNAEVLKKDFHVFPARDGHTVTRGFDRGWTGARGWKADNANTNASFSYFLKADTNENVTMRVLDGTGRAVFTASGSKKAGVHVLNWQAGGRGRRGGRGGGLGGLARRLGGGAAGPGGYALEVKWGDVIVRKPFRIHGNKAPATGGRQGEEVPEEAVRRYR